MTGLFTGAGLSQAAPASLPLGPTLHRRVYEACFAAARRVEAGLLDPGVFDVLRTGRWNLLARLENTLPGSAAGALASMKIAIPNEAQLLAAIHLAHGGLHVTVNFDDGVERAYALLSGASWLPDDVPVSYREALPAWQSCFPHPAPVLHVRSGPVELASGPFADRPLLVKLHGSLGRCPDGVVLPMPRVTDDADVTELGRDRIAALDALAEERFVLVTGYSGSDFASRAPLIARLRPARFSWVAPKVRPDVRSALRAIDPGQPVSGRAVDSIRACLPVRPPAWPAERAHGPRFEELFAAWAAALQSRVAAEALAWALVDAGSDEEAVALLGRLCVDANGIRTGARLADALARRGGPGDPGSSARMFRSVAARSADRGLRAYALTRWAECHRDDLERSDGESRSLAGAAIVSAAAAAAASREGPTDLARATSAVVGILLSRIERFVTTAERSPLRRLAWRAVAEAAAAQVRRALARTAPLPSGRRRALLERQAVELAAIVALFGGRASPAGSLHVLGRLCRTYEHLSDPRGLADTIGTRALVWVAAGQFSRALHSYQEASRLHPAPTGVLATVRDLLDLLGDSSLVEDSTAAGKNGSGPGAERGTIAGRAASRARPSGDADPSDALEAFVRALPKVELHVHLEGSVAPSTLVCLARRWGDRRVPWTIEEVRRWYRFRGYADFLNAYVLVCDQLRTGEDFARVTVELGRMLAGQNVRYAEVTFSPVAHVRRGISPGDLFAGLEYGRRQVEADHGIRLRWCAASGTRRGPAAAMEAIEMVLAHRPAGLVSLGLAGLESAASRARFAPAFAMAREAGLHRVVHAGEAAGPASIAEAIDVLGAERIGHGIRCLEDPSLVARLRRTAIPLEVCPTSNVRTGVVSSLHGHPLPRLLAERLVVSLGTDDPAMFHTNLNAEYVNVARAFGLRPSALADLARSGVRSAFLGRADAEALLAEIDSVPIPDEFLRPARSRQRVAAVPSLG